MANTYESNNPCAVGRSSEITADIDNRLRWAFDAAKVLLTERSGETPTNDEVRAYLLKQIPRIESRVEQPAKNVPGRTLRGEDSVRRRLGAILGVQIMLLTGCHYGTRPLLINGARYAVTRCDPPPQKGESYATFGSDRCVVQEVK